MNTRLSKADVRCQLVAHAELIDGEIWLRALVGAPVSVCRFAVNAAVRRKCEQMGISLAEELLNNGAREILANGDARA